MPGSVGTSNIKVLYTGGATNADPAFSLGGDFSSIVITDNPDLPLSTLLNNLFPSVIGEEQAAGKVRYRCIGIWNNHIDGTAYRLRIKLSKPTFGGGNPLAQVQIAFGWDPALPGVAPQVIASETTAPTGVTFSSPTGSQRLFMSESPPNLGPGKIKALWVKFTVPVGAEDVAFEYFDLVTEWDKVQA